MSSASRFLVPPDSMIWLPSQEEVYQGYQLLLIFPAILISKQKAAPIFTVKDNFKRIKRLKRNL
jgi:hypothetical protein